MKFPRLEIENFLAITKAEISLADRGLVAIQGRNNADTSANSNGAGKSSIADALCWCWFGTTARGATGDDVINDTVGKGTRVSSTIIDGGITYTATRHRKHKSGKNRFTLKMHDGLKETDLTKGTDKLTQIEADKIIGSSLEVFAGSIYAGQEKMPDLPAYTDKQLKMLVEEAAGVTLLEEAYKKAREGAQMADTKFSHATVMAAQHRDRHAQLQSDLAANEVNEKAWETNRKARLDQVATQVKTVVGNIKTINADIAARPNPEKLRSEIEVIDKKIAGIADEGKKLMDFESAVMKAQTQSSLGSQNAQDAHRLVISVDKKIADLQSTLGTPCSECGRPITEGELAASKKSLEKQRQSYIDEQAYAEQHAADWVKALNESVEKRDKFKAGMTDISAEQAQRKRLADELTAYNAKLGDREVLLSDARGLKDKIATINAEVNPYASQKSQIETEIAKTESSLLEADKLVKSAETTAAVEKEVVRVFSPAGVRARILDEVTPFLNAQTSKYLATLSDGNIAAAWTTLVPAAKKGEFKEKFSIEVTNNTGGKSFKTLSGGEKRKVRIATALALQDLVATRASKPIDLFIGDEIDDALDTSGLERLMLILDEKAKERGSVFVISHNDLADFIRQTMTIEKLANGETSITEVAA